MYDVIKARTIQKACVKAQKTAESQLKSCQNAIYAKDKELTEVLSELSKAQGLLAKLGVPVPNPRVRQRLIIGENCSTHMYNKGLTLKLAVKDRRSIYEFIFRDAKSLFLSVTGVKDSSKLANNDLITLTVRDIKIPQLFREGGRKYSP
ncbi:Uncharacterized protein Fot_11961 [Forsythia ovata]|uniref:Uncharacterized protein n=1 Tax=Forsythia ovata TaxID=205694 RepID=A0ABD1WLI6_9LAMI